MNCKIKTNYSAKFAEFPELLFATDINENQYFDATFFLESRGATNTHSPKDFICKFSIWIASLTEIYEIENLVVIDENTGNTLMDEAVVLLFVGYVDPHFLVHILDRVSEMFLNGFVLSDSYLSQIAQTRLVTTT